MYYRRSAGYLYSWLKDFAHANLSIYLILPLDCNPTFIHWNFAYRIHKRLTPTSCQMQFCQSNFAYGFFLVEFSPQEFRSIGFCLLDFCPQLFFTLNFCSPNFCMFGLSTNVLHPWNMHKYGVFSIVLSVPRLLTFLTAKLCWGKGMSSMEEQNGKVKKKRNFSLHSTAKMNKKLKKKGKSFSNLSSCSSSALQFLLGFKTHLF